MMSGPTLGNPKNTIEILQAAGFFHALVVPAGEQEIGDQQRNENEQDSHVMSLLSRSGGGGASLRPSFAISL